MNNNLAQIIKEALEEDKDQVVSIVVSYLTKYLEEEMNNSEKYSEIQKIKSDLDWVRDITINQYNVLNNYFYNDLDGHEFNRNFPFGITRTFKEMNDNIKQLMGTVEELYYKIACLESDVDNINKS